jgi:hypothetical protein
LIYVSHQESLEAKVNEAKAIFQPNTFLLNLLMEEMRIQQEIQMSVNFWFVCMERRKP